MRITFSICLLFMCLVSVGAQSLTQADSNKGLVFWAKCIGDASAAGTLPTTTTTVYDSSGYSHNGTYTGTKTGSVSSTYYSTGAKIGPYACTFDGSTNYIQAASGSLIPTGSNPRTLNVLFKLNSSTVTAGEHEPFSVGANSGSGSRLGLDIYNGAFSGCTSNTILIEAAGGHVASNWTPDTNWHMLTAVFPSGATNITSALLYLDATILSPCNTASITLNTPAGNIFIGGLAGAPTAGLFPAGMINDARIYNRALSANEIKLLYLAHN